MSQRSCNPDFGLFSICILILLVQPAFAGAPFFIGLGDLPGGLNGSRAIDVSADGSVVVGTANAGLSWSVGEAFKWTAQTGMIGLGFLPGDSGSRAGGISADGKIVVGASGTSEAFRWTEQGGMLGLGGLLPGAGSLANAVSTDGSIVVGMAAFGGGQPPYKGNTSFKWTQSGGMASVGGFFGGEHGSATGVSNDGTTIVGFDEDYYQTPLAYRYTPSDGFQNIGFLPGGLPLAMASEVSGDGSTIVGMGFTNTGTQEAFRWTEAGGMVGMGFLPGGAYSQASDVSTDGSVIIGMADIASEFVPFIWNADDGMRSLTSILIDDLGLNLLGWTSLSASAVSGDGLTIVGTGTNPSGYEEAWVAHIPEPATGILILMASLFRLGRRKRS